MNKIYLLAGAVFSALAVNAQAPVLKAQKLQNTASINTVQTNTNYAAPLQAKAAGVELWSNDFSAAVAGDWTTSEGGTHTDGAWSIVASLPAALTTGLATANGGPYDFTPVWGQTDFALINSDAAGGGAIQDAYITSPIIPVATDIVAAGGTINDIVTVQWVEIYRRFQETYSFEYTNDGTTWTEVIVNYKDLDGNGTQDANYNSQSPSMDPDKETEILNLAAPMGGWSDLFQFRFRYQGTWDWFWAVDDVSVSTQADNDITLDFQNWGSTVNRFQYFTIPTDQQQDILFDVDARGYGKNAMTNVALSVDVNGTVEATSNVAASLAFDEVDSLGAVYAVPGDGTYDIAVTVTSDVADDVPANSTFRTIPQITVGGSVYAADHGPVNGAISGSEAEGTVYEIGNYFEIQTAGNLHSIDVAVADVAENAGVEIYANLYQNTADGLVSVSASQEYIVDQTELGTIVRLYLDGTNGYPLEAGLYFAAIGVRAQFTVETAGVDVAGTGLHAYPDIETALANANTGLFGVVNTPRVRMNFEAPVVGVDELGSDISLSVYPNPASNNVNVAFTLENDSNVAINISDLSGKVVYTNNLGNVTAGAHKVNVPTATLSNGVYFYNITVGNSVVTKKLVVKK